jgi:hypothetical protein
MAQETIQLSYTEFQDLATGTNATATIDFIAQLKAGKKYVVTDNGQKFIVALDAEDSPVLKLL